MKGLVSNTSRRYHAKVVNGLTDDQSSESLGGLVLRAEVADMGMSGILATGLTLLAGPLLMN